MTPAASDAYYEMLDTPDTPDVPDAEAFRPTRHVTSTWGSDMQNGAPVSALLVRALERCSPREDSRLSRVVVDLLGPVPMADRVWVRARMKRPGTKIELLTAEMLALGPDGTPRPVAEASGWRFQHDDTSELEFTPTAPLADRSTATKRPLQEHTRDTYIDSIEWYWLNDILMDVPGECWVRSTVDLVAGEAMTPIQRLFSVADVANGMGTRLPPAEWLFLNTDLVVHMHRVPEGEWTGVRSETSYGSDGVGASVATLFDQRGAVASIQQAQLVRRRG